MLKRYGQRNAKLDSLIAPGDLRHRQKSEHVQALAGTLASTGGVPIEPIVVNRKTREIVAGRDRYAAMLLAGVKMAPVEYVTGTADELEAVTLIENYHRRNTDDRAAMAKRLVELASKEISSTMDAPKEDDEPEPSAPGRPTSTRTKAIRKAAEQLGTSPGAVRHMVDRAEGKGKKAEDTPLEAWGVTIPEDVRDAANITATGLHEVRQILARASGRLTQLEAALGRQLVTLRENLQRAQFEAKAEIPVAVCLICKLAPVPRSSCNGCGGRGFVGSAMMKDAPEELKEGGEKAGIYWQGKWYSLEAARAIKAPKGK